MPPHLVIAATAGEVTPLLERLAGPGHLPLSYGAATSGALHGAQLVVAWLGVGKVNTAAGLALAIARLQPATVIQVGIGGAAPASGLRVGGVAVANEEVHLDSGALTSHGFEDMEDLGFPLHASGATHFNRIPVDGRLAEAIAGSSHPLVPFGTSETVTGDPGIVDGIVSRFGTAVESMEGAAAAQVALAMGVPFAEVRGISNMIGERDKSRWRIGEAVAVACQVVEEWLRAGAPATTS